MIRFTFLALLFFLAWPAQAAVVVPGEGAVIVDGGVTYTYHAPYYFDGNGVPHVRALWTFYRWDRYKCCYVPYDRYVYTAVALPTSNDPLWRLKLIDLRGARNKAEHSWIAANVEQQNFEASVKLLGLDKVYQYAGIIGTPYVGLPQTYALSSAGVNASTIYGVRQDLDVYGQSDSNILLQGAVRSNETTGALLGKSNEMLMALTDAQVKKLAEVQAIRERGIARERALRASVVPETHASKTMTKVTPSPTPAQLPPGAELRRQLCFSCHSAAAKRVEAKLDLSDWAAVTPEVKAKMLDRLTSSDPKRLMPRDEKTGMGRRLTPEAAKRILED